MGAHMAIPMAEAEPKRETKVTVETAVEWYNSFESASATARQNSEHDRDFRDGHQWSQAEIATLEKRGQPVVTYNRIAKTVNFICGYEIKTRVDPVARPRTPAHEDSAQAVSDAIRYTTDSQNFDMVRSRVTDNVLVEGYSGCVVEAEKNARDEYDIKIRRVQWARIFYDPHSSEPDFSDARYKGVVTWFDFEDAIETYRKIGVKDAEEFLASAIDIGDSDTFGDKPQMWVDGKRKRVKVCEVYWREADGSWWRGDYCGAKWLREPAEVEYKDEFGQSICPLELVSAYVDRECRRYGMVRSMISAQEEINKRRSKALHLLNTRQFFYEEGVFKSPDEASEQLARPDGKVEFQPGGLTEGRFQVAQTSDFTQGHLGLLQEAKAELDQLGPTIPLIAADERIMSGRAIIARHQAGAMELQPIFENLRHWTLCVYRQIWYRIRQYWPFEKWIRVTDDAEQKGFRFVAINRKTTIGQRLQELVQKGMPVPGAMQAVGLADLIPMLGQAAQMLAAQAQQSGQQADQRMIEQGALMQLVSTPMMAQRLMQPFTENQIDQLDMDIILDVTPDTSVIEQEEFEALTELAGRGLPIPPAAIIKASHLRSKKEILAALQQPDPMRQQAQQVQMAGQVAGVQRIQADTQLKGAQAAKTTAEIGGVQAEAQRDSGLALKHAAEAGQATIPDIITGTGRIP